MPRRTYRRKALRVSRGKSSKYKRAMSYAARRRRPRRGYRHPGVQRMKRFGGFPKTAIVKFRYAAQISINPGLATATEYNFRANDCYDPDVTGGGHQPMGFDQWMAYYDHFVVLGSKIRVRPVFDTSASGTPPPVIGVGTFDTTGRTTGKNYEELLEMQPSMGNRMKTIHLIPMTGAGNKTLTSTFSARKEFRCNPMSKDSLLGAGNASPTEQTFFTVYGVSPFPSGGSDPATVSMEVVIDYVVCLLEPKPLPQS